eukprot:scaffold2458_cov121-Isochrysis_galbana.AAC.3
MIRVSSLLAEYVHASSDRPPLVRLDAGEAKPARCPVTPSPGRIPNEDHYTPSPQGCDPQYPFSGL